MVHMVLRNTLQGNRSKIVTHIQLYADASSENNDVRVSVHRGIIVNDDQPDASI